MTKSIQEWESEWRAEFEKYGDENIRDTLRTGQFQEGKRQFAYRWLGEQSRARRAREQKTYRYVRWTFLAAVAAVLVSVAGVITTLLH